MPEIERLDKPPTPQRITYAHDDGHDHVWGREFAWSRTDKARTCVLPGCHFTQRWKAP